MQATVPCPSQHMPMISAALNPPSLAPPASPSHHMPRRDVSVPMCVPTRIPRPCALPFMVHMCNLCCIRPSGPVPSVSPSTSHPFCKPYRVPLLLRAPLYCVPSWDTNTRTCVRRPRALPFPAQMISMACCPATDVLQHSNSDQSETHHPDNPKDHTVCFLHSCYP